MTKVFIWEIIILLSITAAYGEEGIDLTFPSEFIIATATSAYQVEGAWDADGKGENIWDRFSHEYRMENGTGDRAVDFYHNYPQDIQLLKDIGFNYFRFSISWGRIFPNGYAVNPNEKGVRYYHSLLDELEKQQIVPLMTIYHWDHPQVLEDNVGGWLNESMAHIYADFANFLFKEFGNRVKVFITVNEPNVYCSQAYGSTVFPPAANLTGYGEYLCVQNMLKGHALAYHDYDKNFRNEQKGVVGLIAACRYCSPKNEGDTTSPDIAFDFDCGWVMNPVFSKTGDYPEVMKTRVKERSILQGFHESRLPVLTKEWIGLIRGSSDYFGLNYYTSCLIEPVSSISKLDWPNDSGLNQTMNSSWPSTDTDWIKVVPEGLGNLLRKIKRTYDNPPVYILENGVVDNKLNDTLRINYLYLHMKEVLLAKKRDECDIRAYTVWSFLDSLEWKTGYEDRYGFINIDYNDENLKRTPKLSAGWMKSLLKSRKLQRSY